MDMYRNKRTEVEFNYQWKTFKRWYWRDIRIHLIHIPEVHGRHYQTLPDKFEYAAFYIVRERKTIVNQRKINSQRNQLIWTNDVNPWSVPGIKTIKHLIEFWFNLIYLYGFYPFSVDRTDVWVEHAQASFNTMLYKGTNTGISRK